MSATPPLRIAIVGAGAIGGVFAAWLSALPDVRVSVLARGATLAALQRDGLQLHDAHGTRHVQVHASDDPTALGPQDLVVLAVKGPAVHAVAPAVRQLMGTDGRVLVAMNGVPWWFFHCLGGACDGMRLPSIDPDGTLAATLPPERVIGCVVHLSASTPAPGQVRHVNGNGLIIGTPAGGRDGTVQAWADRLGQAGFAVTVSERIQRDIWYKLWGNMTMNPVSALTGATCDRILDDPLVRASVSAVMREAQAIGARIGCPIDQTPEDRHAVTRKLGAFKTSMLQDVEAGRPIELDALLGAVRDMGQQLNLPTPHIDTLFGLTRLMAQTRGLYPV